MKVQLIFEVKNNYRYTDRDLRGSSQVIPYKGKYIAFLHECALYKSELLAKDAVYLHRLVVWDKDWNIEYLSEPFSFTGAPIEFCAYRSGPMSNIKHASNLEGYAVLVTGGGTGIGAGCAAELAADGAQVTICGRRQEVLDEAAEKIAARAAFGGGVQTVTGDVTSEEDVQAIVAKALEPTGKLNGCIANAGGGGIPSDYPNMPIDDFQRVMNLNVFGTMLCVKHSVPLMVEAGGGAFGANGGLPGDVEEGEEAEARGTAPESAGRPPEDEELEGVAERTKVVPRISTLLDTSATVCATPAKTPAFEHTAFEQCSRPVYACGWKLFTLVCGCRGNLKC